MRSCMWKAAVLRRAPARTTEPSSFSSLSSFKRFEGCPKEHSGRFDRLPAVVAPSPLWGEGWDEGRVLAITRQLSGFARLPLTQRAFRSPAGARVTFLLLAQKKSNPKKTASRAGSTPWDRSVGRFAQADSWLPKAKHGGYTATRQSGEDLKQARPSVETPAVARCSHGHPTTHALSPLRVGALRCSRRVSPWAATHLSGHTLQARIQRHAMSS